MMTRLNGCMCVKRESRVCQVCFCFCFLTIFNGGTYLRLKSIFHKALNLF